jgi:hypothetical protein
MYISESIYYTHYGLHCYKGKRSKVYNDYITFSVNFFGFLDGMTNIQTIFDLVPRSLKHVWCYRSHSVPSAGFQVLNVFDLNLVDSVLHITSGERIQWDYIWRPRRPSDWSHLSRIISKPSLCPGAS